MPRRKLVATEAMETTKPTNAMKRHTDYNVKTVTSGAIISPECESLLTLISCVIVSFSFYNISCSPSVSFFFNLSSGNNHNIYLLEL
ncbi:rCG26325 [Rattus norvegicus]|uniref:RCG26325 n=1 Tax=Rattus norvegicus TaxID=10116 RepID=A6HMT6_RAT|nr:rCG26325 [Rattus norvegicus]